MLFWAVFLVAVAGCEGAVLTKLYDHPYWGEKKLYYQYTTDSPSAFSNETFFYRWDKAIDLDWGEGGPRILADRFSAIFEGTLKAVNPLIIDCDDGFELSIGGKVYSTIEDHWDRMPTVVPSASGKFTLKYFETFGLAHCKFRRAANPEAATKLEQWWDADPDNRDTHYPVLDESYFPGNPSAPSCSQGQCYKLVTGMELWNEEDKSGKEVREWQQVAKISAKAERLKRDYYAYGMDGEATYLENWIKPCKAFELLGRGLRDNKERIGDHVVIKVVMGNFTDYYRPVKGADLCEMLTTNNLHEWAPTEAGPWYKPKYTRWMLGASDQWWPAYATFKDWRKYPTSWGEVGRGAGCCYENVKPDDWMQPVWKRNGGEERLPFEIWARYHFRAPSKMEIPTIKEDSKEWVVYAQVAGSKNTKSSAMYKTGWATQYMTGGKDETRKLHAQFVQPCANYSAWKDEVALKIKFGQYNSWNQWVGDYAAWFRPRKGANLCDMLTSPNKHEWSDDGETFYIPAYNSKMCGGSGYDWPKRYAIGRPKEYRMNHLPFWCGNYGAYAKYNSKEGQSGTWGHSFQMLITQSKRAGLPTKPMTLPKNTWVRYMLHLGKDAAEHSATNQKNQRRPDAIDVDYLGADAEAKATPKAGGVVTVNGTKRTWTKEENAHLPTLWAVTGKGDDYFVDYWSMVVKGLKKEDVWATFRVDDQAKAWFDGEAILNQRRYSSNDVRAQKVMKVDGSKWHQMLFKLYDGGWGSNFAVKFDKDVEWFWSQ